MIKKGNYYDNSALCAECTGSGCRQCNGKVVTRWPLSQVINGCKTPLIAQKDHANQRTNLHRDVKAI